jgi:hypothetical protein
VQTDGLTGHIEFNGSSRSNFTVDVMETSMFSGVKKVGEWSDLYGFTPGTPPNHGRNRVGPDPNKVYIVTSILVIFFF